MFKSTNKKNLLQDSPRKMDGFQIVFTLLVLKTGTFYFQKTKAEPLKIRYFIYVMHFYKYIKRVLKQY